jgi:2-polyprenyl-3-methyl-5-hydroxy-6-metoxy-1,4-benzoquinol methylase
MIKVGTPAPKPDRSLREVEEERMVPWGDPLQLAWHTPRYDFGACFVEGKRVLDAGCGEGYGSARLAETATEVLGVDYSPAAVAHAHAKYVRPNLRYQVMDLRNLTVDGPFDVITCFEVLEHLDDHEAFLGSLAQLLAAEGTLVLSTPNKGYYQGEADNEYHVRETTPAELRRMLGAHFSEVELLGQVPTDWVRRETLKSLDVLGLRKLILRLAGGRDRVQQAVPPRRSDSLPPDGFIFSRRLVRTAGVTLAVAVK